MLISRLLRVKNILTKLNGDVIVDLISATFSFNKSRAGSEGYARVKKEEAMRPDLVAVRLYNQQNMFDVLLKYNGISNPFSLAQGEILLTPPFKEFANMVISPRPILEKGLEKAVKNGDKLVNPKSVKDKKRLEALKDRVKEIVPPNVNTEGNRNVKVKDGRVIFGEDVTQVNKDNCPVPISRARLIQQLTKANLF